MVVRCRDQPCDLSHIPVVVVGQLSQGVDVKRLGWGQSEMLLVLGSQSGLH